MEKIEMNRTKANIIVNDFFRDMNPTFWNGNGDKPQSFDEREWEYDLTNDKRLNICLYYDDIDKEWVHCCEIVGASDDVVLEMLTGYGIDSTLNLIDTLMDLCRDYN